MDCGVSSIDTISLSGDTEAVCVPQTTPGKPDLDSGADFFISLFSAVLDILVVPFLSLFFAVECCKSFLEGASINSPYDPISASQGVGLPLHSSHTI